MFTMLVQFEKDGDIQYHCFDKCKDRISFVHDSIFKAFSNKGYVWSAIRFPIDMAYSSGFTVSDCEEI